MAEEPVTLAQPFQRESEDRLELRRKDQIQRYKPPKQIPFEMRPQEYADEPTPSKEYLIVALTSALLFILLVGIAYYVGDIPPLDGSWASELSQRTLFVGSMLGVLASICAYCIYRLLNRKIRGYQSSRIR